eukprot:Lithocolla_globosa_v1_NODE_274_length_4708_cov_55.871481.p1 type:complete len:1149 gc:universal NODE_274_length_4708_cov_55.871481:873-4319(+)
MLLVSVVFEKEKKIKEACMMMGMNEMAFFLGWLAFYAVFMLGTCLMSTILIVSAGVLPNANFLLIFLLVYAFCLTLVTYSFMVSPFFNKSKIAGGIGQLLVILAATPYFLLQYLSIPSKIYWLLCLLSPVAFALSLGEAVALEAEQSGLTFSNWMQSNHYEGFTVFGGFMMLLFDSFLYLILAWYLNHVVPSEYGNKKPFYFPFTRNFWFPPFQSEPESESESRMDSNFVGVPEGMDPANYEPIPSNFARKEVIKVRNIVKLFPQSEHDPTLKRVLDDVSFSMYEGTIFGLLGHNGAGKSTMMSILSGLITASSGSATMYGLDVARDQHRIRKMMGVCPQHDILFDQLTPVEHLLFFGALKGLKWDTETASDRIDDRIQDILRKVDLLEQSHVFAKDLSGGQKRKLSVGIALVGNPKILFLDEPTAGMDPYSRRKMWGLLQEQKKDKVVLLTTHFMDEADILADIKGVLNHGKLMCVGSSLFLKNRFGLGYQLALQWNVDVNQNVSNNQFQTEASAKEKWLPVIESYVKGATCEAIHGAEAFFRLPLEQTSGFADLFLQLDQDVATGSELKAFSVSMTTLEDVFLRLGDDPKEDISASSTSISSKKKSKRKIQPEVNEASFHLLDDVSTKNDKTLLSNQVRAIYMARLTDARRQKSVFACILIVPTLFLILGMVLGIILTPPDPAPPLALDLSDQSLYPLEGDEAFLPFANNTEEDLQQWQRYTDWPTQFYQDGDFYQVMSEKQQVFGGILFEEYGGNDSLTFRFTYIHQAKDIHALPLLSQAVWSGLFKDMISRNNNNDDDDDGSSSLHVTSHSISYPSPVYNVAGITTILIMSMAMLFPPSLIVLDCIKDRTSNIKHQLFVMGTDNQAYWLSYFLRDMTLYSITGGMLLILACCFRLEHLNGVALLMIFLLLVCFMPMIVLALYCFSFIYSSYETAQKSIATLIMIASMFPYFAVSSLDFTPYRDYGIMIHYIFVTIDPPYAFLGCMWYIYSTGFRTSFYLGEGEKLTVGDYFKMENVIFPSLLILIGLIFFYTFLLLAIDFRRKKVVDQLPDDWVGKKERSSTDSDVQREQGRLHSDDIVHVHEVSKWFPWKRDHTPEEREKLKWYQKNSQKQDVKMAVSGVTLGVKTNECFGLLGPNGFFFFFS